jgi:hypothetical protein
MHIWLVASHASSVEAAGKFGAKFFAFWIIVLLILAVIIGIPALLMRSRRRRAAK